MARRVLRDGHTPLLLLYLRCGAPTGLRGELWARALGVEFDQRGLLHYLALAAEVQRVAQVRPNDGGFLMILMCHHTISSNCKMVKPISRRASHRQ